MSSDAENTDRRAGGAPPAQGLTEAEARRRLAAAGELRPPESTRSYASIVRANVLTAFNVIIAGFGILTLIFGDPRDALFLGVIVANAAIGITQEVRAKHALDRLSLLVVPRAQVKRDGVVRALAVEEVVIGDLVMLGPGDQVIGDGELIAAGELQLDESILTGESDPVPRAPGQRVRSGAFVVEGTGTFTVDAIGAGSYAAKVTGEARSFRHPRSPLERAINRMLYTLVGLVLGLGTLLGYSLHHRHVALHAAVATASAGVVTLIPEGLMVLVSLTYAAAAVRMSRRGVLTQQLNAIESLASVDTICVDKTGTLTDSSLRVIELVGDPVAGEPALQAALATLAVGAQAKNITLAAIAEAHQQGAEAVSAEVPFSSRRRWSAVATATEAYYLGAPGRLPLGTLEPVAQDRQRHGRRVLAVARGPLPLPSEPEDEPPAGLEPLGLVVLAETLRPNIAEAIAFIQSENVEVKVLSGDDPQTVAAIAADIGITINAITTGDAIPADPQERRRFALEASVVGRISPEGKRDLVQALAQAGRYVAMIGDGVNDVPALKCSRLAIAQGAGTQMARSVSDLVLLSGDFASLPPLIAEGRRALRNLQRVAKLYVTKSALAAFLILTIGTSSEAYPLLPRHLTLAASLTIGIPTFFLALGPSSGPWRADRFGTAVARFAVPAGFIAGTGLIASYLFAVHDLDLSVAAARTTGLTTLIATGLYLVMALEAGGSRRRSALVATMCAVMAGLYVVALALGQSRTFFELTVPNAGVIITAILGSAVAIGALHLCGFWLPLSPRRR